MTLLNIDKLFCALFHPHVNRKSTQAPAPLTTSEQATEIVHNSIEKDRWFYTVRSQENFDKQMERERTIKAWYLRGVEYYKPNWSLEKHHLNPDESTVSGAYCDTTCRNLAAYHPRPESLLERIDAKWNKGGATERFLPTNSSPYWYSDDDQDGRYQSKAS